MGVADKDEAFVRELVDRFPELKPMLDEHLDDNFGSVLPHLFLADVMRFIAATCSSPDAARGKQAVQPILDYLEARFRDGDDKVKELISVSFVEVLPRPGEIGYEIRELLGPELAAEAERVA